MKYFQKEIQLQSFNRGYHLITESVISAIPEIAEVQIGQLQVFIIRNILIQEKLLSML